jgi:hypothetical protein
MNASQQAAANGINRISPPKQHKNVLNAMDQRLGEFN